LKKILLCLLALPLAACNPNPRVVPIGDPVAIPFLIDVQATPANATGQAQLKATVRYGGFGSGGPAKVEFKNGADVLAVSTERVPTADPSGQEFTFSAAFTPMPKATYQIRAVLSWTYTRPGSIESAPVTYP